MHQVSPCIGTPSCIGRHRLRLQAMILARVSQDRKPQPGAKGTCVHSLCKIDLAGPAFVGLCRCSFNDISGTGQGVQVEKERLLYYVSCERHLILNPKTAASQQIT